MSDTAVDLEPAPAPATPPASRAGRNLKSAIPVGLAMGATVLVTLYTSKPAFLGVVLAAILVGLWELTRALRAGGHGAPYPPLALGTAALIISAYDVGREAMVISALLTAVAVVVWCAAEGPIGVLTNVGAGLFALFYVGVMAGFAALLLGEPHGSDRITLFVATVVASDVGGYTAGVLKGRHPMAPNVSPKKSWEGFAGSILTCAGLACLLMVTLLHGHWWQGVLFGIAAAVSATVGDLGESMIKRDLGIKDMGHLLPGHGGLMDRLDSLLPTAPIAWMLITLFLKS